MTRAGLRLVLGLVPGLVLLCALGAPSHALDSEQKRGKALLQRLCSRCHAIGLTGASRHPDAPPFRTFGDSKLYDDDFSQRLQTGLSTIHKDMPSFRFDRAEAEAAVNYLKTIQVHPQPK
ncbi:c-type cytochrome [Bradyrhizobium oligotrophicum]|uniref:c-type cytochrome n=1 Tax=Bradyrhizobium oligotrophicum TaxID=44255 RepID=UPI003EB7C188